MMMVYTVLESHAHNNVLVGSKNIFVHPAIFPHTYVPTYHDLSNPTRGGRRGGGVLNRQNSLSIMKVIYQPYLTTCDLDSIANSMLGITTDVWYNIYSDYALIKTKLATTTWLPSSYDDAELANSIESKVENQCGKQKNLARLSCTG